MRDNKPKHAALNMWVFYSIPYFMKFPLQSPDFNPTENLIDILDKNVRSRHISSKMMVSAINQEWDFIRHIQFNSTKFGGINAKETQVSYSC